jgi:hypothetical protein
VTYLAEHLQLGPFSVLGLSGGAESSSGPNWGARTLGSHPDPNAGRSSSEEKP